MRLHAYPQGFEDMTDEKKSGAGLRVALFTGNYNYMKDGVSLTLNRLVGFLLRNGAEVLVVAPTTRTPVFPPTGELISVPSFAIPFRPEYRISLGLTKGVRKRLEDFRPNLFHIAVPDMAGLQALHLAQRWKLPVVASYHTRFDFYLRYYGVGFAEPLMKKYFKYFYDRCEHTYPPSDSMAELLRSEGIEGQMRIWSRGVDRARFNPGKRDMAWRRSLGIDDDEIVISFAGRLVKEKNTAMLMRVLAALHKRGNRSRGLIIGDGPAADMMKALNVNSVFAGFLHGEDVPRALASSDLFMFPSDSETFGNVTLEAMACGLPAICADATGSRSLVTPGKTGYLLDSRNEDAFIAAAEQLIADPALRTQMSANALAHAEQFDWETINSGLLGNYRDAIRDFHARGDRVAVPASMAAQRPHGVEAE